jgi:hypothetical protein
VGGYVINMGAVGRSAHGALLAAVIGSALLSGLSTATAQVGGGCPTSAAGEDGASEHVAATDRTGLQRTKRATRLLH